MYVLPVPMTTYFDNRSIPRHNARELIRIGKKREVYVIGLVPSLLKGVQSLRIVRSSFERRDAFGILNKSLHYCTTLFFTITFDSPILVFFFTQVVYASYFYFVASSLTILWYLYPEISFTSGVTHDSKDSCNIDKSRPPINRQSAQNASNWGER